MKTNLKHTEVSLTIDLKDDLGFYVKDEELRQSIAVDLIDTIVTRTKKGYGVDGNSIVKFARYSPKYAAMKGQTNVDLELYGDMLNAINVISGNSRQLTIGINDENAPKAHGHMTGQEGKGPLPKRPFLGLTKDDLRKIKSKYKKELSGQQRTTAKDFMQPTPSDLGITREDVLAAIEYLKGK